jgi:hypothetical protein
MTNETTPDTPSVPVPTVDELACFDPYASPSPVVADDSVRITAEPSLGMLSPEMKQRVTERLAGVPVERHAEVTQSLVLNELREHSLELRIKGGLGPNANEYEREYFCIAREAYDLDQEAARIEADLEDVVGYSSAFDETGEPVAVPVYRLAPDTLKGRAEYLQSVRYRRSQLERESERRLNEAAERERAKRIEQNSRIAEDREVKQLAAEMQRRSRIEAKAATIANNRRHEMG